MKRKLEELNLLDDFLFGSVLTYPEIGEKFVRLLLQVIFKREFGKMTVVPQKVNYGTDTDKHGARIDVYLEEEIPDGINAAYDVEPDQNDDLESKAALPKRVRFYHAKIDAKSLKSGEKYNSLKNVVVIMITPFDPFDRDRMVYTIRRKCEEEPDMPYDDGSRTIYLYTKGTKGSPSKELRQFLHYMEDTRKENAVNETLRSIHRMVELVKQDEEVSLGYMKIFEREKMLVNQGIKQGIKQGREEEQANTERERKRADAAERRAVAAEEQASAAEKQVSAAEKRVVAAEKELERLKREIKKLKKG